MKGEETIFHLLLDPLLLSDEVEDEEDDSRLISVLQWLFPLVLSGNCCPFIVGCG